MNENELIRSIVEVSPLGMMYVEKEGGVKLWNKAAEDIFGWSAADVVGGDLPFIIDEHSSDCAKVFDSVLMGQTHTDLELKRFRRDGRLIDISLSTSPVSDKAGNIVGLMGVFADITDRKRAEECLLESENLYRSIFETTGGATLITDPDSTVTMINDEVETITGYNRKEFENKKSWTEILAPIEVDRIKGYYDRRGLYNNETPKHYETIIVNKYGVRKNVFLSFTNIAGSCKSIISIVNITELKQAAKALEEQVRLATFAADIGNTLSREEDLQKLFKRCTEAVVNHIGASLCHIWTYDKETNMLVIQSSSGIDAEIDDIYINVELGMYEIGDIGLNRRPIMTNNVLTEPFFHNREWAMREGILSFGGYPLVVEEQLIGVIAMFCRRRLSEFAFRAMVAAADNIANGIKRKLVESEVKLKHNELQHLNRELEQRIQEEMLKRQQKEQMLIQQSKMAAMGEMIGAIAHQWRQPLNAVGLIVQDLEDAYEYGEIDKEYIQRAVNDTMKQIQFMSKTIDDFRNFFRPAKEKEIFNCFKAIQSALSIVNAQLTNNTISVKLTAHNEQELYITGFSNEFKQAMLNIINNAKDAITENRKQSYSAHVKGEISIDVSKENNKIVVIIADNGGGIDKDIIDRVFEPYFTTKDQGKGTGIGLYMSKTIIERSMNGKLDVRNVNNGAEFRIEI